MVIILNLRFFSILNPYNSVPLTAQIKLGINYSNELEYKVSKQKCLIALNDTFLIQDINLNVEDLLSNIKAKQLEAYRNNEFKEHPSNNHCKIFCN